MFIKYAINGVVYPRTSYVYIIYSRSELILVMEYSFKWKYNGKGNSPQRILGHFYCKK